jgi:DNA-binding transcriptional regulator YhcF (GntR family)
MHTVNKAYAVLRDEGYVVMRRRSGAVIADRQATLSPETHTQERDRLADDLRRLALEHRARGGSLQEFISLATAQAVAAYGVAPMGADS